MISNLVQALRYFTRERYAFYRMSCTFDGRYYDLGLHIGTSIQADEECRRLMVKNLKKKHRLTKTSGFEYHVERIQTWELYQ